MQLPLERGPISRHVIETLRRPDETAPPVSVGPTGAVDDDDGQLALWILYELHYRGFDDAAADREWDSALIGLRGSLEHGFEQELRAGTRALTEQVGNAGDISQRLFALVAADDGPALASYLHREATREQVLDFLKERSIQQLKESDPQSFVLPRIDGPAKVALAELQYDEYGAGRPDRLHATLYSEALRASGLDNTYGAYINEVSALSLASANVMSLFGLHRRMRGAAMGYLAAFEATSSVPSRKIAAGIERVGLPESVADYFHEHVEADAVHEQVAIRDICGDLVAQEPSLADDVMFGAAACLHLAARSGGELLERWTPQMEAAS